MEISFKLLGEKHFSLLFLWLEEPHVSAWWGRDKKYLPRTQLNSQNEDIFQVVYGFLCKVHNRYVGYCQYYNALNYSKTSFLKKSGHTYAGFDMFLGEKELLRRGVASNILKYFIKDIFPSSFEYLLVDPERKNMTAGKFYERNGFSYLEHEDLKDVLWMVRARTET